MKMALCTKWQCESPKGDVLWSHLGLCDEMVG